MIQIDKIKKNIYKYKRTIFKKTIQGVHGHYNRWFKKAGKNRFLKKCSFL